MYLLYKCSNLFVMNSVQLNFPTLYCLMLSKSLTSLSLNFLVFCFFFILTVVSSDILISADGDSILSDTQSYLEMAVTQGKTTLEDVSKSLALKQVEQRSGMGPEFFYSQFTSFTFYKVNLVVQKMMWLYNRASCNSFRICLIQNRLCLIWLRIY